jgi:hypothetical protein
MLQTHTCLCSILRCSALQSHIYSWYQIVNNLLDSVAHHCVWPLLVQCLCCGKCLSLSGHRQPSQKLSLKLVGYQHVCQRHQAVVAGQAAAAATSVGVAAAEQAAQSAVSACSIQTRVQQCPLCVAEMQVSDTGTPMAQHSTATWSCALAACSKPSLRCVC